MSQLLVVFGATGTQGGSVVDHVLNDPELSAMYRIRGITRDIDSAKARQLVEKSVDVVKADALDRQSLEKALAGAHTVFIVTAPALKPSEVSVEYNMAKAIADVSVQQGAQYIIFSTLTNITEISGGKYTRVYPYDAKARAEKYIRSLPVKSAFFCGAAFMSNFQEQKFLGPEQAPDGTWVFSRHNSPTVPYALIDGAGDTGKFVGAILAEPDKYEGKTFCAAQGFYTLEEACRLISRSSGKTVVYKQVSPEDFWKGLAAKVGDDIADIFLDGFSFYEEFGAFGPGTEEKAKWAKENARGKLRTFEEFLDANPFQLS
ncbi:uncharacterized protein PV09_01890 [Verruconis gallopava]|uniref:NmrA-like domain-containing protein n=1 Tax=Verruconis gallopava TaxID=253628 RepID=A0A0D1XYZ8_9PEZI|nr:uncharacterized protein PV09_01890 [Verruconis gallopava]KIW07991.1 hypothetical protein PV09_01890 [Verruconis gallopava]